MIWLAAVAAKERERGVASLTAHDEEEGARPDTTHGLASSIPIAI